MGMQERSQICLAHDFGILWEQFSILLDHVGISFGACCNHFNIILESFWNHFDTPLGVFLHHFGFI